MRRTLIVTNDFPPRQGGIQSFVHELALRLDPGQLTVYAPKWDGDAAFDAAQPFEVVRHPTSLMIGGPSVRRRAAELARSRKAEVVIFGASAPLGLIAPVLRKAGVRRAIAITHGHEAGWAALPVGQATAAAVSASGTDVMTYLGEYFRVRVAGALTSAGGGQDDSAPPRSGRGHVPAGPGCSRGLSGGATASVTARWSCACSPGGPARARTLCCAPGRRCSSRSRTRHCLSSAAARTRTRLHQLAERTGVSGVRHLHRPAPLILLPGRTTRSAPSWLRRAGPGAARFDVEGLGIVYLEASATGLPVVGGDSGGAPDAIIEGETGYVVPGRDVPGPGRTA